jgi:VIT1/CCC1 family predicted Fe2+/Mn2+ transporter
MSLGHSNLKAASDLLAWAEEKQSAYLYRILAGVEGRTRKAKLFESLAQTAEEQALIWEKKLSQTPPAFQPSVRARFVGKMIQLVGARPILHVLAAMKVRGISVYSQSFYDHEMPTQAPVPGQSNEPYHRKIWVGANLRAAVFGVNDGLVSNASLILGVAGAKGAMDAAQGGSEGQWILTSGIAGLLAGAFSMAAGEYLSVRSQRELFEYQIGLEKEELKQYPEEEARELALIYEAKGILAADAKRIADQIVTKPEQALDALAREELGLNPSDLGSPWGAAFFSFFAFALGAMVPLVPYFFMNSLQAFWPSIVLSVLALFGVGAAISLFTGKSALKGALRMAIVGGGAGALTFAIGHFFGAELL